MFRIGPLEYLGSLGDQFDELAAELHVSAFGVLMAGQVAGQLAAILLQHVEPLPEEVFGDQPVKAIVVEAIHEELLLFDFGPDFFDDRLVVGALLLAALGDSLQQPRLGVLRDGNAGQQGTDLLVELLLANVGPAARRLAGTVVVDVALLLQLRGEVTAAGAADQQALVREVVFLVDGLLVGAEGRLDRVPQFARHQRRMAPSPHSSFPAKVAEVEGILEQPLQLAEADELCLFGGGEALIAELLPQRLE
ncbi:MAG: hypothetical protein M3077_12735 [Candidatus Dormibacteraeota bacterium]|nr:hypothetical protein [Candidatus Dormibacteraeota bacterium]